MPVCVHVSGNAAAATSWPHLDMQVQSGASGVSAELVSGIGGGTELREVTACLRGPVRPWSE